MESNRAAEHLQVIRLLMERSAVYRRALMPVMLLLGGLGLAAAGLGWLMELPTVIRFSVFWIAVCLMAISSAYTLVRRQALRDREPFWSPPTRRVTQAFIPGLCAGAMVTLTLVGVAAEPRHGWWLVPAWSVLYGCAVHAAGFFMPRGIKLFGWCFIIGGSGLALLLAWSPGLPALRWAHLGMGVMFGGIHLAYGVYLHFTERARRVV